MGLITYDRAAETIAPLVQEQPDSPAFKRLLLSAEREAWMSGKWWGMYKEYFIRTVDNYLTLPGDVSTIIGINVDNVPQVVSSRWFQFHKNGPGTLDECKQCCPNCNWSDNVMDMGEVPTFRDLEFEPIAVVSQGCEEAGTQVTISGLGEDCKPVYTFTKKPTHAIPEPANSVCTVRKGDDPVVTTYGESIDVFHDRMSVTRAFWTSVVSITKPVTRTPVDVYAVKKCGEMDLVARLEPHQTSSCLRRYRLPDTCSGTTNGACVHVVAKVAEPQAISGGNQPMITPSMNALTDLVISADFSLNKKNLQQSEAYRAKGIRSLDEQLNEKRGDTVNTIQVVGPEVECHKLYQFGQEYY